MFAPREDFFALAGPAPAGCAAAEWRARLELAACYRLFDWLGWAEGIYNHITLRLDTPQVDGPHADGAQPVFLINPYGLHYGEVSAANLLKIDSGGRKLDDSPNSVNAAGLVIHSAVHGARADAHCVMHTHTTSVMAVACKQSGLRDDNFYSAYFKGRVGLHPFEGITTSSDEGPRLVASLGTHPVLLLRNHGVVVVGASIAAAFEQLWTFQRACDVQLASDSMAGANLPVAPDVLARIGEQAARMTPQGAGQGELLFYGMLRRAGVTASSISNLNRIKT